MLRIVMTTLLGLIIAIGSMLGMLAWRSISVSTATVDLSSADPAIGYAFYDGIGQVLAGKDASALQAVLAPGFVDHQVNRTEERSATELIDELTNLSQTFPGATFKVITIEAASGTLVAAIDPVALDGASIAGVPFRMQSREPVYEVLRVRNGKVVERWSDDAPSIGLTTFDDAAFTFGGTFSASTRLDRFDLQKHASVQLRVQGKTVLMGEAGITRISMNWITEFAEPKSAVVELAAGETVLLPSGARVRLDPEVGKPARFLRFVLQQVLPTEPFPPILAGNVTNQLLRASVLPILGEGDWTVSIGQLLLSLDSEGELVPASNDTVLLSTNAGSIEIVAKGGEVSAMGTNHWPMELGATGTVDSDTTLSISDATSIDLHSDATAPAWLIVVARNHVPTSPVSAGTPLAE